jgi:hypothetical protein
MEERKCTLKICLLIILIWKSVCSVNDASFAQLVETLGLRDSWRVVDLAYTLLALAFTKGEAGSGCMCHDIATDRLLGVDSICHATTWVCSHLVCYKDCYVELFAYFLQAAHDSIQDLLPVS